jgi:hypothetical protein
MVIIKFWLYDEANEMENLIHNHVSMQPTEVSIVLEMQQIRIRWSLMID